MSFNLTLVECKSNNDNDEFIKEVKVLISPQWNVNEGDIEKPIKE